MKKPSERIVTPIQVSYKVYRADLHLSSLQEVLDELHDEIEGLKEENKEMKKDIKILTRASQRIFDPEKDQWLKSFLLEGEKE